MTGSRVTSLTPAQPPADFDAVVSRAIYLSSRVATAGSCSGRISNLIIQLQALTEHPQAGEQLQQTCAGLVTVWQDILQQQLGTSSCHCNDQ